METACLVLPGIGILALIIVSGILGARAFQQSHNATHERQLALRLLALNLCEPIIGAPLTLLTLFLVGNLHIESHPGIGFLVPWPMLALLIPGYSWTFHDPVAQRIGMKTFVLGGLRLLCNALCFGLLLGASELVSGEMGATISILIVITFPSISIALLAYTCYWAYKQLKQAQQPAQLQPTNQPAAVVAARPASAPVITAASVVPTMANHTLPCPTCHTPLGVHASSCPSCGLVFASRVPTTLRALPRYTALRPLGEGGMSSIYLALDRASETFCILKTAGAIDLSDHRGQSDARMCLEREALILRDLHHPGIIELLGWYPEEQAPFMALTYVPGPSLEQRLAHGPLPLGEALRHATGIAQAIRYLASQRHPITHCDIKPSNLIAPPGGPAILLDFGSAVTQTIANTTRRLDHYGTPGYAAPEQYQHQASPASDIYALAATLYHLVTGDDPTTHPLAFPALWRLPAELQEILSAALERNPASRPTPDLFAVQLQRAAQRYG